MNRLFIVLFLAATFSLGAAGCGGSDPASQLESINALLAKNFPLTVDQRSDVDKLVAEGGESLQAGDLEKASAAFGEAIEVLEFAEDAAMFNKSE